jgi:hypothetical protein
MSEMVERVAKAIGVRLNEIYSSTIPNAELENVARAAIAAMRQPTQDMIEACKFKEDYFEEYLKAMIDEALSESQLRSAIPKANPK